MSSLLRILREHPEAVEADLSHYHRIDYRDRWRTGPDGCRRLTLRMIWVRIKYLPPESALGRALERSQVTQTDALLADVFHALTGKPHPLKEHMDRPSRRVQSPERQRKLADARRRAAARQRRIEAGEIT